ncbi:stage II sporulation protein M [Cohnella sp. REN36]|uniref:stage II sporulation protein M n=1 Tax=Cohnella sp. REN36 TaxID=2887347 RepID=UPI001D14279A|nr:stage II sporulation protein M [Cohnella sp. REN36]MCC3376610.1 stage II sporulation protein M [Cohnella sp. REN36]
MFSRQALKTTWAETRPYVVFAVILFFAGVVAGGASHGSMGWLDSQIAALQNLADQASASSHPRIAFFKTILLNNVYKSVLSLYLGLAAAIMPIIMLVLNGVILGYLFGLAADGGANVWLLFVKGILPHGIFELPAIFLACGYGIRLGVQVVRGIGRALFGRADPWANVARMLKMSVPVVLFIAVLLLVAALLESTLTYQLVQP